MRADAPSASDEAASDVRSTLRRFGVQRVRPWLAEALAADGFERPSAIQEAAMPRIARREDVVIHAHTGSGKTLAFLVPLLSRLEPRTPLQLLLLAPSRELALQLAAQLESLVAPAPAASRLRLSLVVGGVAEGGELTQRRELEHRAGEVVVATVDALRRVLDVGRDDGFGGGRKLELRLASNLDAIVLDEVDALLPPPALRGQAVYRRKDWAKAGKDARRMARRKVGAAPLLRRIARALEVVGTERRRPPQIVGASATVSRGLLLQLREALDPDFVGRHTRDTRALRQLPAVVGVPERLLRRESAGRGVAGVGVPTELRHWIATSPAPQTPEGVAAALRTLQAETPARGALVVLPDREGVSLNAWIDALRRAGLAHAEPLHGAMGFPTPGAPMLGAKATPKLLRAYRQLGARDGDDDGAADAAADAPSRLLVTTEASCRGIDVRAIDIVLMLFCPNTADKYVHLAGRAGRGDAVPRPGTVLMLIEDDEARRVGMLTSQLQISVRRHAPLERELTEMWAMAAPAEEDGFEEDGFEAPFTMEEADELYRPKPSPKVEAPFTAEEADALYRIARSIK